MGNIITVVFTFGGGKNITHRHLPVWKEYSDDILLVFPDDDPCLMPDTPLISHEVSNKFGLPCLKRQLFGMKAALRYPADYYVFTEYDGFMLKRPEPRDQIQANVFADTPGRFEAGFFTHFPWVFPSDLLKKFCASASFEPFEEGFVDRWLAAQLKKLGMPVFNLQESGEGYSRNSIESPEEIHELLTKVKSGAYALHGIKDARLLNEVLVASRQTRLMTNPVPEIAKKTNRWNQSGSAARRS